MKKTILFGLIFFCTLTTFSQNTFIYNEKGEKIILQENKGVYYIMLDKESTLEKSKEFLNELKEASTKIEIVYDNIYKVYVHSSKDSEIIALEVDNKVCVSKELLYEPDSTILWSTNEILLQVENKNIDVEKVLSELNIPFTSISKFGCLDGEMLLTLERECNLNSVQLFSFHFQK